MPQVNRLIVQTSSHRATIDDDYIIVVSTSPLLQDAPYCWIRHDLVLPLSKCSIYSVTPIHAGELPPGKEVGPIIPLILLLETRTDRTLPHDTKMTARFTTDRVS
ncbi:hypothetical protein [Edwardsiella tarda]|uniref:hypothetical protein n=1 Tax=Edwardsiella tarda TaxID=636 RepID=UPI00351C4205